MNARSRIGLLILTLLGLAATAASSYVHYHLLRDPSFISFCDVNETVSCTAAYLSPYGSLFGIPVAILGVCFFTLALLLQVGSRVAGVPADDHVPGYLFAMSVPGLALGLYLAYAAFFVLHAACILCIVTYVSLAGLFILSGMTTRFSMTTLPGRFARDAKTLMSKPAAIVLVVLFVAGAASALAFFPRDTAAAASPTSEEAQAAASQPIAASEQQQLENYIATAPRSMIPVDSPAQVVVVKFNDYQCPPCRQTYDMYKPLKAKWEKEAPGKVKWVTKDFPLEPECNATVKQTVHPYACEAAAGVRMARKNSKGDALEDWIFANQTGMTLEALKQAIRDVGGVQDFDKQYPIVLTDVKGDTALGGILGVGQTPTFYLNGVKLPALQPEYLNAAIAFELKRTTK